MSDPSSLTQTLSFVCFATAFLDVPFASENNGRVDLVFSDLRLLVSECAAETLAEVSTGHPTGGGGSTGGGGASRDTGRRARGQDLEMVCRLEAPRGSGWGALRMDLSSLVDDLALAQQLGQQISDEGQALGQGMSPLWAGPTGAGLGPDFLDQDSDPEDREDSAERGAAPWTAGRAALARLVELGHLGAAQRNFSDTQSSGPGGSPGGSGGLLGREKVDGGEGFLRFGTDARALQRFARDLQRARRRGPKPGAGCLDRVDCALVVEIVGRLLGGGGSLDPTAREEVSFYRA